VTIGILSFPSLTLELFFILSVMSVLQQSGCKFSTALGFCFLLV